ncbi:hypothetical protein [Pontibacter oryzae]|uniref:Uncharacterized protein n=1 Tax=Pontibacter oryzae TaxID=2304593 RepID=A0A399RTS6_9BACT|nr:hypothetical protein [Pontibacter oryzae]RIJ33449.1 hypothetical protein D1627_17695 [Pontibacter oryzae]
MKTLKTILLAVLVLLFACAKEAENIVPNGAPDVLLVQTAKQNFDEMLLNWKQLPDTVSQMSTSNDNPRHHLAKAVDWQKAEVKQLTIGEAVVVPLKYSKELFAKFRGSNTTFALNNAAYMMLYKHKSGEWRTEVITVVADEDFLNGAKGKQPFSGIVVVEDWNGKFIRGFKYSGGRIFSLSGPRQVVEQPTTQVQLYDPGSCTYVDWYSCGGGECHYMYTEVSCTGGGAGGGDDGNPGGIDYGGPYDGGTGGSYNDGGVSGGGSSYLTPPSTDALNSQIQSKPFSLLGDVPCDLITKWLNLAAHQTTAAQKQKVNNIIAKVIVMSNPYGMPISYSYAGQVLDINNAYSTVVNMDYFSVNVTKLPVINGQQLTPQQLLDRIRRDINSFVDVSLSEFTPYNHYGVDDTGLWYSSNPTGAVVSIAIPGNSGSVITSSYSPNSWTFSTIRDPFNGNHPVSGNREFSYVANADGSYTFYTRGVDRLTDMWGTLAQNTTGIPFNKADALWTSFQTKIESYVNHNSGSARVGETYKERPDWAKVKEVMEGKLPLSTLSKNCLWD